MAQHPDLKQEDLEKDGVVFLDDDPILMQVVKVFSNCANENMAMVGVSGKKYESVKDECRWGKLDLGTFVNIIMDMGVAWASHIPKPKKK